jgi:hypothetical protein
MTHIINTKIIQSLCDLNLLLGSEKSSSELLALAQCRLNDLEVSNIAQEVTDWLVGVVADAVWVLTGGNCSKAWMGFSRAVSTFYCEGERGQSQLDLELTAISI